MDQETMRLLAAAADRIRSQQTNQSLLSEIDAALGGFVASFTVRWGKKLRTRHPQVLSDLREARAILARCRSKAIDPEADVRTRDVNAACIPIYAGKELALAAQEHRIGATLAAIEADPAALLLPLGTCVRLPAVAQDGRIGMPAAGAAGVVVGYADNSEWPLSVALPRDSLDGDGKSALLYDGERPWSFRYAADELSVIGYGNLVGIGQNEALGYIPTHCRNDDDGTEMIIEAEGRFWRVWPGTDGLPGLLMAADSEDAFSWLVRLGGREPASMGPR